MEAMVITLAMIEVMIEVMIKVTIEATIEPDLVCFSSTINMSIASASLPWPARARAAGSFSSHAELGSGFSLHRRL